MTNIKWLLFDWGDTLMVDDPEYKGEMFLWPEIKLMPDAARILPVLSEKYHCAVVSNALDSNAETMKKAFVRMGIDHLFELFITSKEIGYKKPDERFFNHIAELLHIPVNELCMIGNDYEKDIVSPKKLGLKTVLITQDPGEYPSADHIIRGLGELDDILLPNIYVRLAVPADAPDMAEIHARSWEVAYKDIIPAEYIKKKNATRPALYKRIITDENKTQYVIEADGKTVGIMCIAAPQDSDADDSFYELHGIYLHPDHYRQGIGTKAMEFACNIARSLGKTNMTVWVFAENTNAISFYKKCGFAADGATKTLSCGREKQCVRMRRTIS
ncbi:MAG: GNAT family N-acetyltransferase [Eubacteriales bacterium]